MMMVPPEDEEDCTSVQLKDQQANEPVSGTSELFYELQQEGLTFNYRKMCQQIGAN